MSVAPLITKGFGSDPRIITIGFNPSGVTPTPTPEPDIVIRGGRSSIKKRKEDCDEYLIKACLLEVNKILQSHSVDSKNIYRILKEHGISVRAKTEEISHSKSVIYEIHINDIKINEWELKWKI